MPEAERPQPEEQGGSLLRTVFQSLAIYLLVSFVMKQFFGLGGGQSGAATGGNGTVSEAKNIIPQFSQRPAMHELERYSPIPQFIAPIWPPDTLLDISICVSPSFTVPSLGNVPEKWMILDEREFRMSNWQDSRQIHTSFTVPREVQNNGTLWAHFFVGETGSHLDPSHPRYETSKAYHFARPLNQYLPKRKAVKERNLLTGSDDAEEQRDTLIEEGTGYVSYYHPNFTLSVVPTDGNQNYFQMHPAVREWVQLERSGARDVSGQNGWYYPILFLNTFWQLRNHMTEINSTVTELPLNIDLNHLAFWKFTMISGLEFGLKNQAQKAAEGGSLVPAGDGSEFEEIKRILLDSNMYLLGTTVIVSILHSIFEMLAFKNDVSHWRNKKDNVGVSVRTILANVFMQTVIFLYLMDNNEHTSWMILFGQGMGIAIEAWKVTKTVNVRIRRTPQDSISLPWRYLPYMIVFEDKHKLSETEVKTQEYDQIAFRYMYWVGVPLVLAYAIYSLVYQSHKSWYSFLITTLVGSVYAYGFLLMVPSLYINYRLKSVAHMPSRAMIYKVLGTFVDDLFAFTIKMPTLHRLATLRDDVIFFVYLYQKYKYRIDYSRVNEFGQGGTEEAVEEKIANKPLQAPGDGAVTDASEKMKELNSTGEVAQSTGRDTDGATKRR